MNSLQYNDGLLNAGRTPKLFLVLSNGNIVKFQGENIPGILVVKSSKYQKNGKWSNTTYQLEIADGVGVWEATSQMHQGYWDAIASWEEAQAHVIAQGGHFVSVEEVKRVVLATWEKAAARFDTTAEALAKMTVAPTEPKSFTFGSPTNRAIENGYWESPKEHDGVSFKLVDPTKGWTTGNVIADKPGIVVTNVTHRSGMHGGYYTIQYMVQ
ncbi:MAG: hypothetical protein HY559_01255 [Gammaproteobacteria bacterium]|nr:hypothetical protein [Gammaproteobacteria bacterium]